MSATSARRLKDRNGVVLAGTKPFKPFKPVTPVPISGDGKENRLSSGGSRPTSKVRPRPTSVTRPERSAGACRLSASSAPRGRSSSPSEFLRDRRRDSAEKSVPSAGKSVSVPKVRVSDLGKVRNGVKEREEASKSVPRVRVSRVSREENGKVCDGLVAKKVEREQSVNGDESLSVRNSVDLGKTAKELNTVEVSGAKESKHQSKLHEKLAFLEGKVKRIATDIKRTKEMLDQNNPDASKVILLDIQDKITGIEKAMGQVGGDSKAKNNGSLNCDDDRDSKTVDKVDESGKKAAVNGLNNEELEARLFPHHKLLRNRKIAVKASSGCSDTVEESTCKALSPIDANPIAMEFLASLSKDQLKVTTRESGRVEEMDDFDREEVGESSAEVSIRRDDGVELILTSDERLEDFDDQENTRQGMNLEDETEENSMDQLYEIGHKPATGGWFVSEGESVILAHDDGSCRYYDVVNNEEKAVFEPRVGVPPNIWRDCWVIRAASADGCQGRYVVAASAGNAGDSGFCSWDFYTKEVRAFHVEKGRSTPSSRMVLGPLPNNVSNPRNSLSNLMNSETRQWWYKPCGPLMVATASSQRAVRIFDVRDGEKIMNWNVQNPVLKMDYSSPLQWRNRGKVVVAETEGISLWDVNTPNPEALLSVSSSGRIISALHVNNSDAELGGGVRQRLSSSEAEGNDGVFCTQDSINVLDFRHPTGVGLKIPKHSGNFVHSVFSRGDLVFLGCSKTRPGLKQPLSTSEVHQVSLRMQRLFCTYPLPECSSDLHQTEITQVWGNSNYIMAVCGEGLFVFDALRDGDAQFFTTDQAKTQFVSEIVGPENMYLPTFDYATSRALVISRDRPAMWRHLS